MTERPAGEVDRGIVVALVRDAAHFTGPVLGPANVLDVPTAVARLPRREVPVGFDQRAPIPGALLTELSTDFSERCVREPPPACSRTGQALLTQLPATSSPSTTIVPWFLARFVVKVWIVCLPTLPTSPWRRLIFSEVSA